MKQRAESFPAFGAENRGRPQIPPLDRPSGGRPFGIRPRRAKPDEKYAR